MADKLQEETQKMSQPFMDQSFQNKHQRKFETKMVLQDKFQNYLKTHSLVMPEPSSKLEKTIKLDMDYSKNTKISKIKSLTAIQKTHSVIIKKLKD